MDKKLEKRKEKKKLEKNDVLLQGLPQEIIELMGERNTCYGNEINTNKTSDMDFESDISQTSDHIENIIAEVARFQSVDEIDHTGNSSDLNTSDNTPDTSVTKEEIKDLTPERQTDSFTVTREDVLSNLRSQRRRHSSITSVSTNKSSCSGISTLSGSLPGFMRTPEKKFRSPMRAVLEDKSDITDVDLMDEQFLSQESRKSVQMFTNISSSFQEYQNSLRKRNKVDSWRNRKKVDSPRKRNKVDSDSESSQSSFKTPNILSPKKTKIKKNFVPGF